MAIKIIKVNDTTYIKFNEETKASQTIDISELQAQKIEIETRLAQLDDISDEALLIWAKKTYPRLEFEQLEKAQLTSSLERIETLLNEVLNGN